MDFFNTKNKTKDFVLNLIEEEKFSKIDELKKQIEKENEYILNGIEEAIDLILNEKKHKEKLFNFMNYLISSENPINFKLYFELLLFNFELYESISIHKGYENIIEYDHFLLELATDYKESEEIKIFALSVLSLLKDSFFIKESMSNNIKKFDK